MKSNISILILTLNEEINLPFALGSCSFADRIYVLDSGSSDGTQVIAENFGAHFIRHAWQGYAKQKNWGIDNLDIESDWVFILDADEEISQPLREEIIAIATGEAKTNSIGFYVNRYFVWQGKEIRHCGYYPSWNIRFFRKGKARYEEREIHEHMIADGTVGFLKGEMRHEDRRGLEYIWQKHMRYADLEAKEMVKTMQRRGGGIRASFTGGPIERRRAVKKYVWPYLPGRWFFRFVYMYVIKRGFLDGSAGLDMCIFMSQYEKTISRKFTQYRKQH